MQLNEKIGCPWAELGEAARAPYVQQAHAERDAWQPRRRGANRSPGTRIDRENHRPCLISGPDATLPAAPPAQKSEAQVRKQISEMYKALTPEQRARVPSRI